MKVEKLSKTWKCAIAVGGVLIVIGVWRGCSKRALERTLENMGIAKVKQLNGEVEALVKGIEDEVAAERAAEAKMMEDIRAVDTKRFLAERAAQEKAEREREDLFADKLRLRELTDEVGHKVAIWGQALQSDWKVFNDVVTEINSESVAELDAVEKDEEEAVKRVREELAKLKAAATDRLLSATSDSAKWYAIERAQSKALRRVEKEARTKIDKIKAKANAEREAIAARVKERISNSPAAKSKCNLTKFYKVFGKRDYWRPTESGVYFYYRYKEGTVVLELRNDYYHGPRYDKYGLFDHIYIDGPYTAYRIPTNVCLANEDSFQPLKNKSSIVINKLIADWRARALEKSPDVSIEAFCEVFGNANYLGANRYYYCFYYDCKEEVRELVFVDDIDSPYDDPLREKTKIIDVIAEFRLRREDFDEGRAYIVGMSTYKPSSLADFIKDLELKAKRRKSGQSKDVEQKTAD